MKEIKYSEFSVFDVEVQTIVNTVNCEGVMGAGLALEFKLRYPEMYQDYVKKCEAKALKIGEPYVYKGYENVWILNFPTKKSWRNRSKLDWIKQGLAELFNYYKEWGIESIAFPRLGCDKGGLNWEEVRPAMETWLKLFDAEVYVCLDSSLKLGGVENLMVDFINDLESEGWKQSLGVGKNLANKIAKGLPIQRFREVQKLNGVGEETYKNIFCKLYEKANAEQKKR